jgi:hypothetical protein
MRRIARFALALTAFVLPAALPAQPAGPSPDGPVDRATRRQVIDSALARLRREYVEPAAVERMAAAVRSAAQSRPRNAINSPAAAAPARFAPMVDADGP